MTSNIKKDITETKKDHFCAIDWDISICKCSFLGSIYHNTYTYLFSVCVRRNCVGNRSAPALSIVNLGMPLDYRLIAGAGVFTFVYILSRAIGKIGGAYIGGKLTKAQPDVTKYLGFTLLPHSGVSLVFTGIATTTLSSFDSSLASVVSGTIVAAAIINEIIAVIVAKYAFKWAGELKGQ